MDEQKMKEALLALIEGSLLKPNGMNSDLVREICLQGLGIDNAVKNDS